jgi:hypothetical protein
MNNILYSKNASPLKNNMEEGQFSLYKKLFRQIGPIPKSYVLNGQLVNNKFQDSSSYMERKKTLTIGQHSYNKIIKYNSYDPVGTYHTKRRVISAGTISPKKKNIIS